MRHIESPPPNLGQSSGRYPVMGSKGWVPRTVAGRVGGTIFGTVFVASGLLMLVSIYKLKQDLQNSLSPPPVAFVVSVVAITMVLAVGSLTIWFGSRLLAGSFRHTPNRKGEAQSRHKEFHA
jgi:hypothetical protein